MRRKLKQDIAGLGVKEIIEGAANFLLFYLPSYFPPVYQFLKSCKAENLFLRDVSNMGQSPENNAVRIAVKDEATNKRMIEIMERALVNCCTERISLQKL